MIPTTHPSANPGEAHSSPANTPEPSPVTVTGLAQDCPDTLEMSSDRPAVPSPPPTPDRNGLIRACPHEWPITGVPAPRRRPLTTHRSVDTGATSAPTREHDAAKPIGISRVFDAYLRGWRRQLNGDEFRSVAASEMHASRQERGPTGNATRLGHGHDRRGDRAAGDDRGEHRHGDEPRFLHRV
jgi:hypothetical protein